MPATFSAQLEKFDSNLWGYHFMLPKSVSEQLLAEDSKRVVCEINGKPEFQCALMPAGEGKYFINVNKKLRDQLKLTIGSELVVSLRKDTSEYGLPVPEEMAELLRQDEEGNALFHALTPGKQRNLLYIAGQVQHPDLRLKRAMLLIRHLKHTGGKVVFKQLAVELKQG